MANLNQTSGRYLLGILEMKVAQNPALQMRHDLAVDICIKQRSYALINKTFFVVSVTLSLLLLIWPVIVVLTKNMGSVVDVAILQTIATAATAGAIYVYQIYKKRQLAAENLLRQIVFGDVDDSTLLQSVIAELSKIDIGFGFQGGSKAGSDKN